MTQSDVIRKLRELAPTTTQSEAARKLGLHRQGVHKLARDHGIRFYHQRTKAPKVRVCSKCNFRLRFAGRRECLRCKWTPQRVKRLRERYGMSQIEMSLNVLGMHVWAFTRWESGRVRPSRRALALLEKAEWSL